METASFNALLTPPLTTDKRDTYITYITYINHDIQYTKHSIYITLHYGG